jgi:hypothetical protein
MAEERWAIHVDGIKLPGYNSYEEAQARINADPNLKTRGAVAVQLVGAPTPTPSDSTSCHCRNKLGFEEELPFLAPE